MKAAISISILFTLVFVFLSIRKCIYNSGFPTKMCAHLCDQRGRELGSIDKGFLTRCYCGKLKPTPKDKIP